MFGINQLGAVTGSASPGGDSEWNAYFGALRDNVNSKWSRAVTSYKTLKNVRETLGLPFIVDQGTGEGSSNLVGAWSSDLEQQAVNVHAMVVLITGALDDVVANKRRVSPHENDSWAIERLPTDVLVMRTDPPGIPVLVNGQTGQKENAQGTVGVIWIPVALVAAATIVTAGEIYLAIRAIDALESMMKEKTTKTIAKRNGELIANGATPAEAAALTKAEGQAAADLAKARAEEKNAGDGPEKWSPLVKTVVWGGVAIMALYIAAKLIPSRSGGLATNPIKENPKRRRRGGRSGIRRRGSYWVQELRDGRWRNLLINQHTRVQAEHNKKSYQEMYPRRKYRVVRRQRNPAEGSGNPLSLAGVNFDTTLATNPSRPATPGEFGETYKRPPPKKYHLTRVHLNQGGYTSRGRYFGVGKPLYEYESTDGDVHGFLRASSRAEAKKHLRDEQGGALFFNPLSLASLNLV
jgi:hypothetical protein